MTNNFLKQRIQQDMKDAMKARNARRLLLIRSLMAEIKQEEIDNQITLDDPKIVSVINKMVKQRQESIRQFQAAERFDLVENEMFEEDLLKQYTPPPLSDTEVESIVKETITSVGASSIRGMSQVMGRLRPRLEGFADMAQVSSLVKKLLLQQS